MIIHFIDMVELHLEVKKRNGRGFPSSGIVMSIPIFSAFLWPFSISFSLIMSIRAYLGFPDEE